MGSSQDPKATMPKCDFNEVRLSERYFLTTPLEDCFWTSAMNSYEEVVKSFSKLSLFKKKEKKMHGSKWSQTFYWKICQGELILDFPFQCCITELATLIELQLFMIFDGNFFCFHRWANVNIKCLYPYASVI